MINSMKVRIKDNNLISFLKNKMYSTKHFENILLILIQQDYTQNQGKNFKYLINGKVMRAVLVSSKGGKNAEKVNYIKEFYKNNELMNSLIEVSKNLKVHNLVEQIKDIKKNYKSYFTKVKKGDTQARPPKAKKLSKIHNMTIFMDGYKGFTFKHPKKSKNNTLGFNLDEKMRYTHVNHEKIIDVVGNLNNIDNININYSNGNFYFLINYTNKAIPLEPETVEKYAGLDIGLKNLASIYIDDYISKSLIVSGERYVDYNSKFNRFIAKINSEIEFNKNLVPALKEGLDIEGEIKYLYNYRSFLYEKRNNFFYSEFHKISKRILKYLKDCKVTHFVISKNLAELKNNGESNLRKDVNQNFIQIPFIQLLKDIEDKAHKFGIKIIEVDEAYTSKTSSISKDIIEIQKLFRQNPNTKKVANVFGGVRAERGLYKDKIKNIIINADINGARNIIKLGKLKDLLKPKWFKLCNPFKANSDSELLDFIERIALG